MKGENKKLISMTDYVINKSHEYFTLVNDNEPTYQDYVKVVINYARFLKQPLTLGMFIPCDLDGNVLNEPTPFKKGGGKLSEQEFEIAIKHYQEAKERVLFEGVEIRDEIFIHDKKHYYLVVSNKKIAWNFNDKWVFYEENNTIEDLIAYNLTLTTKALNKLMK
jgi:hypothetical protein